MGRPFPPQNCPFPCWDLDSHLIHGSLDPSKSSTQTASRSVQPFLQGSLVWQTEWLTDHATRSVTIGRICVRSTAMRPNNYYNSAQKLTLNLPSHGVGKLSWPRHIVRECSACPMLYIGKVTGNTGSVVMRWWPDRNVYLMFIIRPHCSTMYIDAAHCYRQSSVVCLSQSWNIQKWPNRSRCRLGSGLGWAQEGSMC